MLRELIVAEKQVKYLTVVLKEVDWEDDQKTDGWTVNRQISVDAELKTEKGG